MGKHTPGPRFVERQDEDDGSIYYAVHRATDYEFIANFDNEADAILDAAAPDLLAPCLALKTYAEVQVRQYPNSTESLTIWGPMLAAISKATGGDR